LLRLNTDGHKALRGLSATAELLVAANSYALEQNVGIKAIWAANGNYHVSGGGHAAVLLTIHEQVFTE